MSAFIVDPTHVAALVKWYARSPHNWESDRVLPDYRQRMAGMLYAENVRSVNHRYASDVPDEPIAFTLADFRDAPTLTPVQVIKACQCLDYQSCETEDWERTPAYKTLCQIKACAISSLPGYDEAPWSIDRGAIIPS